MTPNTSTAIPLRMMDKTLDTIDGYEITIPADDWKILKSWPGLEMTKLVVVDGEAYPHRKDGTVNSMSISDLLLLARAPAPQVPQAAAKLDPEVPKKPAPKRTKAATCADIIAATFSGISTKAPSAATYQPTTGKGGPPPIWVDGRKTWAALPDTTGPETRVVLVDSRRKLVGYAALPTSAYCDLVRSPKTRVDSSTWTLGADGVVTTRCRAMNPPQTMDLGALLGMVRRPTDFTVETLA
jgi:hypothetical protein